ncbi:MAG: ABC transporter ATP-binding protein [Anaerolineaceae bacterium]|nr:ABC transporter ATP-binding protein [Anaerolineaceae bacterium]
MQLRVSIEKAGYDQSTVISNIHFNLQEGQLLAVIGPNGSGKTTLIRAISQVLPFIKGQLHINGTDLFQTNENRRARLMSVVPQSTYVPPSFLVQEVVLMGRTPYMNWNGKASPQDKRFVREAMEQTNVEKFKNQMCGELSAGERQRVILARALAQNTPVLLMDEPTSHLDLRYQVEFLELTRKLGRDRGKTVLVAMHDLNLAARFGDLILAMESGKTAAFGSVKEILQPDTLSAIYGLPIDIFQSPENKHILIIPS